MWLPFNLGRSSGRHEGRSRWRRKVQHDHRVRGRSTPGGGHVASPEGCRGREKHAQVAAGLERVTLRAAAGIVEAHSVPGCTCADSFNPRNPTRQALLLPPFYRRGMKALGSSGTSPGSHSSWVAELDWRAWPWNLPKLLCRGESSCQSISFSKCTDAGIRILLVHLLITWLTDAPLWNTAVVKLLSRVRLLQSHRL